MLKAFGLLINEAALAGLSGEAYWMKRATKHSWLQLMLRKMFYQEVLEYPKPNLDTIVYDTGSDDIIA